MPIIDIRHYEPSASYQVRIQPLMADGSPGESVLLAPMDSPALVQVPEGGSIVLTTEPA